MALKYYFTKNIPKKWGKDRFSMISDPSHRLKSSKMIFWKLPKNLDFWWKFQIIRFFIFMFLEPKKLAFLSKISKCLMKQQSQSGVGVTIKILDRISGNIEISTNRMTFLFFFIFLCIFWRKKFSILFLKVIFFSNLGFLKSQPLSDCCFIRPSEITIEKSNI